MRLAPPFVLPTTLFLTLLLASLHLPAAAADFGGVWTGSLCPEAVQPDSGQCATFVLEMQQRENRLCGTHMFATAGAVEMDEGGAPSVVGEVMEDNATVIAISGRGTSPLRLRAELSRHGSVMKWTRLEDPPGDHLFPRSAILERTKAETLLAPLFAQELKAMCALHFNAVLQPPAIADPTADSNAALR